jgi:nucleoid-associated protein YgaU
MPAGMTRSASAAFPQVESYDEETYVCTQGDTFETISEKFYHSKDHAQALMQFNHTHPRAAAPLLQNPPALGTGVAVYVPPVRILDKQFSPAAPSPRAPVPVATSGANKLAGDAPKTGAGLQYKVRRNDEMVPLIARDVLGDVGRWTEIYQLNNRGFDPSRPIPTGTVLALPNDAKVPPENVP